MSDELLLCGARVVDPVQGWDEVRDIAIKNGRFVAPEALASPCRLDLSGLVLAPGFIDLHVHLREPGQTHKEDISTATQAAAAGGFTTVLAMPNTAPPIDDVEKVMAVMQAAAERAEVRVLQTGALTTGRDGKSLPEYAAMQKAGVPALTDDGGTPQDAAVMRAAMLAAAKLNLPVIDHCEDYALSQPGVMHAGEVSARLQLPGQPHVAETSIVARNIALARETGCKMHLQHMSAGDSVAQLREARRQGVPVTGEVTPHHLFLNETAAEQYGVMAKMAPPLRTEDDRLALLEGVIDGTITCIATDHAPHTDEEKAAGWQKAPFGIIGLEAAIPLCLNGLYHTGLISLSQLVALFTKGPRELLDMPIGSLQIGEQADVTILELETVHQLQVAKFASKSRNCPYDGWVCRGRSVGVLVGGQKRGWKLK